MGYNLAKFNLWQEATAAVFAILVACHCGRTSSPGDDSATGGTLSSGGVGAVGTESTGGTGDAPDASDAGSSGPKLLCGFWFAASNAETS